MSEHSSPAAARQRVLASPLARLTAVLLATLVAGCTENLDGGAACPALCPVPLNNFRDTTIDAVVLDTSLGTFPSLGLSATLLVANRPDTVETRGIIRFDALPLEYFPNNGSTRTPITEIDSVYLKVLLDSTGGRGIGQVTLEAFDVDTVPSDAPNSVVRTLFRPDRLLGSVAVVPKLARDTLRIPLSKAAILAKIVGQTRLRIGLRFAGTTSAQLRIIAFQGGVGAPFLSFEPTTDTIVAPVKVTPITSIVGAESDVLLANTVFAITDQGTADVQSQVLGVGGWPSRRAYLRFEIPTFILDSSTVVRADLLLTQVKSGGVDPTDTMSLVPMINTATTAVTDIRRALDFAAEGYFGGLDSLRLVPGDSVQKQLNVVNLVRAWSNLAVEIPRAIIFRSSNEGAEPAEIRFYSREAPAQLRPRLRITYLPRLERAIP